LTHSYDILYPGAAQASTQFGPLFACFERKARRALAESTQAEAFKQAENRPFYFVWWPDPANGTLAGAPLSSPANTDPRFYYKSHEQQTSWMLTVPLFPSL
jgi:hypothetical protein